MALFISLARSLYIILHSTMEIQFGTEFYRSASVNIHFHKVIAIIFLFIPSPGATSFPKPLMMIIENDFSIVVSRPVMSMLSILSPNQTTNNHNHHSILTILFVCLVPPQRPEIQPNTASQFQIDQDLQVNCVSRNGRPPAQLYWFLDNEQIFEGVSRPRISDTITNQNTTLYTVTLQLNRRLRASDDHKFLICRSIHPADQPQEDRIQLQVKCEC